MILFKGGQDPGLPPDTAPNYGIGPYKKCSNYQVLFAGVAIYKTLLALKVPCVYHYQPKGFHAAYDEEFCTKATNAFFKGLMNGTPYSGSYLYYQQSW